MRHTFSALAAVALLTRFSSPPRTLKPTSGRHRAPCTVRADTIRLAGKRYVADLAEGGQRRADARSAHAAEHRRACCARSRSRSAPPWSYRFPTVACWRWSGNRPPIHAWASRSWRCARGRPPPRCSRSSPRRRWSKTASWAIPAPATTAASRRCWPTTWSTCPRIDRRCDTLAFGLGKSQNAIIAKLATRHLTAGELARVGRSFGFDEAIPFDIPVEPSHLDVPADGLEFARTAAGFWHSTLSPMHGALLAAAIANRGDMPAPMLIDRARDRDGRPIALPVAAPRHGRRRRGGARGGADDGADDAHRHGQGDVPRQARAAPAARRGRGQDRNAVGRDRSGLRRLQLVRRLRAGGAPRPSRSPSSLGNNPNWRIKATYVGRHIVGEYVAR